MKLLFMGSGAFAVPSLEALIAATSHDVSGLFTQPDKEAGRGHRMRATPTKDVARAHGIDVHQPAKVRTPEGVALVEAIAPECIVVVAYGQIIPKSILELPPKGIINVHASLLPRYRGAAPIQWAIARGETRTGVTTMLMDEGLDTGDILLKEELVIAPDDTSATLSPRLADVGAELLVRTLDGWADGAITPERQDDALATKAPRIKKEDALIDWRSPSREIGFRVRAFDPWPVAHTTFQGTPLKIWSAVSADRTHASATPGTVLSVEPGGVLVGCGDDSTLNVLEVQPAGKARMASADFARGRRLTAGDRLGEPPLT